MVDKNYYELPKSTQQIIFSSSEVDKLKDSFFLDNIKLINKPCVHKVNVLCYFDVDDCNININIKSINFHWKLRRKYYKLNTVRTCKKKYIFLCNTFLFSLTVLFLKKGGSFIIADSLGIKSGIETMFFIKEFEITENRCFTYEFSNLNTFFEVEIFNLKINEMYNSIINLSLFL